MGVECAGGEVRARPGILTALDEFTWTGGSSAPWAYIEMMLWRDVYRCTPVELEGIVERYGVQRVLLDLAMVGVEAENRRLKREA